MEVSGIGKLHFLWVRRRVVNLSGWADDLYLPLRLGVGHDP
ncbi:hypothetical protein [Microtetraspora malaysiensis]